MLEILIFGAMAVLLAIKLRSILGQEYDESSSERFSGGNLKDVSDATTRSGRYAKNNIIDIETNSANKNTPTNKADSIKFDPKIITLEAFNDFIKLRHRFPQISPEYFLAAGQEVFKLIIQAYSENDINLASGLMESAVAKHFIDSIDNNKANKIIERVIVVKNKVVKITKVAIGDQSASVSVNFETIQINYTEDCDGNLVSGSKSQEDNVNEIWTFTKSFHQNRDMSWLLSSIHDAA